MDKQNVLITGASRGLGGALADRLLNAGEYEVFGTANSPEGVEVMNEKGIHGFACDFLLPGSITWLIHEMRDQITDLDFLVNNAWVRSRMNLEDMTSQHILEILAINMAWPMTMTKDAIKNMKVGNIVFVNSTAGLDPCWGASWYVASKHAMTGFADSIRFELQDREEKIWVSDVFLGGMNTGFHSEPRPDLMCPMSVADEVYKNIFEGTEKGDIKSVDLLITWARDIRRPVKRNMIEVEV